jgi:hypothetical protein
MCVPSSREAKEEEIALDDHNVDLSYFSEALCRTQLLLRWIPSPSEAIEEKIVLDDHNADCHTFCKAVCRTCVAL